MSLVVLLLSKFSTVPLLRSGERAQKDIRGHGLPALMVRRKRLPVVVRLGVRGPSCATAGSGRYFARSNSASSPLPKYRCSEFNVQYTRSKQRKVKNIISSRLRWRPPSLPGAEGLVFTSNVSGIHSQKGKVGHTYQSLSAYHRCPSFAPFDCCRNGQ